MVKLVYTKLTKIQNYSVSNLNWEIWTAELPDYPPKNNEGESET